MKCLKCEKDIQPLMVGEPPQDYGMIDGGGEMEVSFGYGSRHDTDTAKAFVCDDCFTKYQHLFAEVK